MTAGVLLTSCVAATGTTVYQAIRLERCAPLSVPHTLPAHTPPTISCRATNCQVLQMEQGPSLQMAPETFNLRLEELAVIDMAFLAASSSSSGAGSSAAAAAAAVNPVLALLYEDNKHARHVKTYTLNLKTRVGNVLASAEWCMQSAFWWQFERLADCGPVTCR